MTVEVYADVLFLINAGMDALCLLLTTRLLHKPLRLWRLLTASALGGAYAVIALFMEMGQVGALVCDVALCVLMCLIALGGRGEWRRVPLYSLVFLTSSMVMGGVMTALYQLLKRGGVDGWLPAGEDGLSAVAFVLLAGVGGLATHLWGRFFRKSGATRTCTLEITLGDGRVTVKGMVDSGNLLRDPMGGGAVIPVRLEAVECLLSPPLRAMLSRRDPVDETLWRIPEASRVRLIPTGTATGEGMMLALRPDGILLIPEGRAGYPVTALIAPTHLPEAPTDALVPDELLS